jgi:hypothetical protein
VSKSACLDTTYPKSLKNKKKQKKQKNISKTPPISEANQETSKPAN